MSGITGDLHKLTEVRALIDGLSVGGDLRNEINATCAEESRDLIADGFEHEADPSGAPWPKSRRAVKESGKTLQDTGHLRDMFDAKATNDGFNVRNGVQYAAIHQFGGVVKHKERVANLKFNSLGRFAGKRQKVAREMQATIPAHGITIPARPMLPVGSLPAKWLARFQAAADAVIQKAKDSL